MYNQIENAPEVRFLGRFSKEKGLRRTLIDCEVLLQPLFSLIDANGQSLLVTVAGDDDLPFDFAFDFRRGDANAGESAFEVDQAWPKQAKRSFHLKGKGIEGLVATPSRIVFLFQNQVAAIIGIAIMELVFG